MATPQPPKNRLQAQEVFRTQQRNEIASISSNELIDCGDYDDSNNDDDDATTAPTEDYSASTLKQLNSLIESIELVVNEISNIVEVRHHQSGKNRTRSGNIVSSSSLNNNEKDNEKNFGDTYLDALLYYTSCGPMKSVTKTTTTSGSNIVKGILKTENKKKEQEEEKSMMVLSKNKATIEPGQQQPRQKTTKKVSSSSGMERNNSKTILGNEKGSSSSKYPDRKFYQYTPASDSDTESDTDSDSDFENDIQLKDHHHYLEIEKSTTTCSIQHRRNVEFSSVDIKEFNVILGDHPNSVTGPPICLDPNQPPTKETIMGLNEYEQYRDETRRKNRKDLKLTCQERKELILANNKNTKNNNHYTLEDIDEAWRNSLRITELRKETILQVRSEMTEEYKNAKKAKKNKQQQQQQQLVVAGANTTSTVNNHTSVSSTSTSNIVSKVDNIIDSINRKYQKLMATSTTSTTKVQ